MIFLDFEQPIADLYTQLEKLENIGIKGQVDVHTAHDELKRKIKSARKEIYSQLTPWQCVQVSRHPERPYTLFYISQIAESFIELHGDRKFKDDKSIVGGLAKIEGQSFMIIGHQKGINTKMRQYRNFGMPYPEGYRKALRLMKLAEKFNIPVLTFIDTPGAYPGIEAEERGQAEAIARNLFEMTNLKVPILSYVIGEGASGGAVGIGVADKIFMLQYTWYSVISPEGCASILWRSSEFKAQAASALKLTAQDMLNFKLIDGVLKEPVGGAHVNGEKMAESLKEHILKNIADLIPLDCNKRRMNRIAKYEKMGRAEFLIKDN